MHYTLQYAFTWMAFLLKTLYGLFSRNLFLYKYEENVVDKEQLSEKTGAEVKKNDVKGKENQEKGKKIMVQNNEMKEQEKEKEI